MGEKVQSKRISCSSHDSLTSSLTFPEMTLISLRMSFNSPSNAVQTAGGRTGGARCDGGVFWTNCERAPTWLPRR